MKNLISKIFFYKETVQTVRDFVTQINTWENNVHNTFYLQRLSVLH